MKYLLAAAALAAMLAPARSAEGYDQKLEEQAVRILARNIGDIRGTLPYDTMMVFAAVDHAGSPSFQKLRPMRTTGKPYFQVIE